MSSSGVNLESYLIPLDEIKRATENFSQEKYIGGGGFGKVYKGDLSERWKNRTAAVKRLAPDSYQGEHEFRNELEMISTFHHENIISFIGYCDEDNEMIIVYEYASNGSLDHHLQDPNKMSCITWMQRLEICIGAARGLDYLHSGLGEHNRVIHRDVKSANILLDGNLVAKICDFGLSKTGPRNQPETQLHTKVAGTQFYMDPTYHESRILRKESDVYSFGVVLFEILSGMLVYRERSIGDERQFLMNTVRRYHMSTPKKVIDPCIRDQINIHPFDIFTKIAYRCINFNLTKRPRLRTVIKKIEVALYLERSYREKERNKEKKKKKLSPQDAAMVIQMKFQEYLMKRTQTLYALRELAFTKGKLIELRDMFNTFTYRLWVARDTEEREKFSNKVIVVLIRIDAIEGVNMMVRAATRPIVDKLEAMLNVMDQYEGGDWGLVSMNMRTFTMPDGEIQKQIAEGVIEVVQNKGKKKELSPQDAAMVIQMSFRAYMIKRSQVARSLRKLAFAKAKLKEPRALFKNFSFGGYVAQDAEERKKFSEKVIILLITVDIIEGADIMVRVAKRSMVNDLEAMLYGVDPQEGGRGGWRSVFMMRSTFDMLAGVIQKQLSEGVVEVVRNKGKKGELSPQDAAMVIQMNFRAYLMKGSYVIRALRKLSFAKIKLKLLWDLFVNFSYRRWIARDAEEREKFSEKVIVLLIMVDIIKGGDILVRVAKWSMVDNMETMLDAMDTHAGGGGGWRSVLMSMRKFDMLDGVIQKQMEEGVLEVVRNKRKELSPHHAAIVIQMTIRAFLMKRSQAFHALRELAFQKEKLKELRDLSKKIYYKVLISRDAEERKKFEEKVIVLLLTVDAIEGVDVIVRVAKRSMVDELESMLDVKDPDVGEGGGGGVNVMKRRTLNMADGDRKEYSR